MIGSWKRTLNFYTVFPQSKNYGNFSCAALAGLTAVERIAFTRRVKMTPGVKGARPPANLWFLSFRKKGTARRGLSDKLIF